MTEQKGMSGWLAKPVVNAGDAQHHSPLYSFRSAPGTAGRGRQPFPCLTLDALVPLAPLKKNLVFSLHHDVPPTGKEI